MTFILTIYKYNINGMIYIGSSWDYDSRKINHKSDCYNELSNSYNYGIYKYIRENNIDWDNIIIEDIYTQELNEKNDLFKRQTEQKYIDEYDSKNNGLNTYNAYITKEERKEQMKEYRENHKEELKEYDRLRNETHREEIKQKNKKYREKHKEELKRKHKEYRENHKEEIKQKKKEYYENYKEEKKQKHKEYYEKHKEEIKQKRRLSYQLKKNKIVVSLN